MLQTADAGRHWLPVRPKIDFIIWLLQLAILEPSPGKTIDVAR